ncbi:MAG: peptidase, partial [Alphaproteobacteria bacterium]
MKSKARYSYGWVPDAPDQRDFLYKEIKPVVKVKKDVDLRVGCSAIENQGRLGSCTAQALAGNLEFLDNNLDGAYTDVSRLFIYYNERALIDTIDYDSGASLR